MKKWIAAVLALVILLCLVGCSKSEEAPEAVGEIGANQNTIDEGTDEAAALSEEEAAALGLEQGLLDEPENTAQEEGGSQKTEPITPDQVAKGGNYKVVLGDYMNSITLYYENGKLVKIVEEFQKNSDEEAETAVYEGDALADYGFNFIDWDNATLQDILDGMKDYGNYGEYRIYEE